jgi:hypothetical protein
MVTLVAVTKDINVLFLAMQLVTSFTAQYLTPEVNSGGIAKGPKW